MAGRVDRFSLFATPIAVFRVPGTEDLNRELTARLVQESTTETSIQRSNAGGWHSRPDLSQRREPVFRGVCEMIVHHVRLVAQDLATARGVAMPPLGTSLIGWAMVMRENDYTILHDHADSHFSMVYYVDAGDADTQAHPNSGDLTFIDPRRSVPAIPSADLFPTTFSVTPETGTLVVFPGSLQHYVHPYRGTRPRISLSCNARLQDRPR